MIMVSPAITRGTWCDCETVTRNLNRMLQGRAACRHWHYSRRTGTGGFYSLSFVYHAVRSIKIVIVIDCWLSKRKYVCLFMYVTTLCTIEQCQAQKGRRIQRRSWILNWFQSVEGVRQSFFCLIVSNVQSSRHFFSGCRPTVPAIFSWGPGQQQVWVVLSILFVSSAVVELRCIVCCVALCVFGNCCKSATVTAPSEFASRWKATVM